MLSKKADVLGITIMSAIHCSRRHGQSFAHVQVSFFRSNLMLRVVPKPTGKSSEGNPADLEALVRLHPVSQLFFAGIAEHSPCSIIPRVL